MTGYQSKKAAAQDKLEQWGCEAFNAWWDSDYDDSTNPYERDSFAYWAWAGWQAALAQPAQEPASVTYKEVQDSMNALEKGTLYQQVIAEELGQRKLYTTPPAAQPAQEENGITNYAHSLMVKCFNEEYDKHLDKNT